jgi:hypothetical protein
MLDLINTWGVFPWNPEHGHQHIHPDDLAIAQKCLPTLVVFQCVAESEVYITLKYKHIILRVKPELYQVVDEPIVGVGGSVSILVGSAQCKKGTVEHLTWHFKDHAIMYTLSVDGKVRSRRYVGSDLSRA